MNASTYGKGTLGRPSEKDMPEDYRERLVGLFETWDAVRARNRRLSAYYNMKNELKDLGISIPKDLLSVNCVVGWCKKAVDAMAVRSMFDGYSFDGAENGVLSRLVTENRMRSLVQRATASSLVHGPAILTVMRGRDGQPAAKVRATSANQGAVLWDKDDERIGCGIVLNDVDDRGNAIRYTAHFPEAVLTIKLGSDGKWDCEPEENPLGRPMMEVLAYDADLDRPLGHSLLTPEILGIVDKAMRDVLRMEVGAEFFTFPQRYILGAASDLFSTKVDEGDEDGGEEEVDPQNYVPDERKKVLAYLGAILAITRDEDGNIPTVGEFHPSSAENFTVVFENDAQRFSGATNVPLAQLGVLSSNYTSSDALNAANDPLVLAVETMNRQYSDPLASIGAMMLQVAGEHVDKMPQVVWRDPSMPTISARADAWTKLGSVDPSIVGTRLYYEQIGLSQEKIERLEREKRQNGAIASLNSIAKSLAQAKAGAQEGGEDDR